MVSDTIESVCVRRVGSERLWLTKDNIQRLLLLNCILLKFQLVLVEKSLYIQLLGALEVCTALWI